MPHSAAFSARLERLLRAGNLLRSDRPLDDVLQWIADQAAELIGARYAAIGMLAPDNLTLESFTTSGIDPEVRARIGALPSGRGVLGVVIREARPIRLRSLGDHPRSTGIPEHHPPMGSFLGVPVVGRTGVLGNLYLTDKLGAEEFSEEDEHLAILLAEKAAVAVEDARRHEETQRLVGEVQTLLRSRERFFAMVNHELRNSLAAVFGWAEMLVRKKDPGTVPRAAFEVVEAAESAIRLINDLLDLSRLDEDRLQPVLQAVDCGLVIRSAVAKVTPLASEGNVSLDAVPPAGHLTCVTDASRVEQILVNVLRNGIRHSPPGATVELAVGTRDGAVTIEVLDRGPGIPDEEMERIFDVYITNPGEEGSGIGLGLPLSRRLARLLGGDLMARNRPGGGAAFTLSLPLRPGGI